MSKERQDPRESIERTCDQLRKFAADGYTVKRQMTRYLNERPGKHHAKVETGIRIVIDLESIA